jgi:RNA polymerase sigma-70 factor, ECF subfamily
MNVPEPGSSAAERFGCVAAAWQAHHGELLGYLRHRLGDADTAADLLHDVFVKAMRQGQGFCRLDDPRAWLFQVARNAVVDRARAARPTEPLPDAIDALAAPEPAALPAVDELAGCLVQCLDELSPDDAEILRGCDLQDQTVRAWAEARGLGLAAAKSRLLRARQRLRERMTRACQVRFDEHGSVDGHVPRAAG